MSAVESVIRPTGGRSEVLGIDPVRDPDGVQARVGYLPGDFKAYPDLTGELLILDEPTTGLDPLLQREFLALVPVFLAAAMPLFDRRDIATA